MHFLSFVTDLVTGSRCVSDQPWKRRGKKKVT